MTDLQVVPPTRRPLYELTSLFGGALYVLGLVVAAGLEEAAADGLRILSFAVFATAGLIREGLRRWRRPAPSGNFRNAGAFAPHE